MAIIGIKFKGIEEEIYINYAVPVCRCAVCIVYFIHVTKHD